VNIYTNKNLIVATALPGLNTQFSNKILLFNIPVSLRIRGYATESASNNNNIDNSNRSYHLNDLPVAIASSSPKGAGEGGSLEEGVPSLDDLLKFKEEIQKEL
jgi:hypothetical protein